jgi:two-component system sensor kinase FixL
MNDTKKTKAQLIHELATLRQRITQLEETATERLQLDTALQEEPNLVSAVLDTISALVVVLDPQGRIVRFNQACERTTGYTFDEVQGKCVWELFLIPEETESVKAVFEELRVDQFPNTHENFWITKDGRRRLIAWSNTTLLNLAGSVAHVIGTGIDITERRQAEEALLGTDTRTRAILEAAVNGIITIDEKGIIESFNQAAERLFGYPAEEVIGQNVSMLMPSPYREMHDSRIARYLETGVKKIIGIEREATGQRKDGTVFPVTLTISELRLDDRRIFTGIVHDITEHKRAEQEMQRVDRLTLVGQLASGLAHEIGTPLNVIAGNAELLRMQLQSQSVDFAELDAIIEQADRITRLIERLLTFARAKEESMEPISLHEPLSHALRLLEARFRREAITVIVEAPADLPLVRGTVDQLEQVFLNIMVNAWHAMPDGGTITIQACETNDQRVQITFRDTGLGMSAAELERAFEPFYSTKEHGTGLGLAISQQIIDSHRGSLRLDSTLGEGTVVIIELPRGDAEPGGKRLGKKSPI